MLLKAFLDQIYYAFLSHLLLASLLFSKQVNQEMNKCFFSPIFLAFIFNPLKKLLICRKSMNVPIHPGQRARCKGVSGTVERTLKYIWPLHFASYMLNYNAQKYSSILDFSR